MEKKIFCCYCDDFLEGKWEDFCRSSQNVKETYKTSKGFGNYPKNINKNNDCKWFRIKHTTWFRRLFS
jgi:hypothetical protein